MFFLQPQFNKRYMTLPHPWSHWHPEVNKPVRKEVAVFY